VITQAEIAIVGAGPAGATVARLMAEAGREVLLLHSAQRQVRRLEVLPPGASPLVEALGLTRLLARPDIALPCLGIRRSWASAGIAFDDFLRRPGGTGHVVDREAFDAALRDSARLAGARIVEGARLTGARRVAGGLLMECGTAVITARFAVDATGRVGAFARRLGATRIVDTPLFARRVQADATCRAGWLDVAAMPHGWRYDVSGPGGAREAWLLSRRAGSAQSSSLAGMARLDCAAGEDWLAIGDAASAFDPLASQGLWQALASALSAADTLRASSTTRRPALVQHARRIAETWDRTRLELPGIYAGAERFVDQPFWQVRMRPPPATGRLSLT